jgi:hypothetical protein
VDDGRRPGPRWGRIVLGLLLTAAGAGWLLDGLSVEVPWNLFPATGLIVVGAVLLLSLAGGTGRADVVVTGIVLLLVAVAVGAGAGRFAGPPGDRTIVPSTAGWPAPTRISAGTVTVDLTDTPLPAAGRLDVAVGAGRVVVRLPAEPAVRVHSTVVMGTIVADGVAIGQGVDLDWTAPGTAAAPVTVDIGVGAGEVEVSHERP